MIHGRKIICLIYIFHSYYKNQDKSNRGISGVNQNGGVVKNYYYDQSRAFKMIKTLDNPRRGFFRKVFSGNFRLCVYAEFPFRPHIKPSSLRTRRRYQEINLARNRSRLKGTALSIGNGPVHITDKAPQLRPEPKPTKTILSFRFNLPSSKASTVAIGIDAVDVLPYL